MRSLQRGGETRVTLPDFISLDKLYERATLFRKVPATMDVFYLYRSEISSVITALLDEVPEWDVNIPEEVILEEIAEKVEVIGIGDIEEHLREGGFFFMNLEGYFENAPVVSVW